MEIIQLNIQGMTCASCVAHVEKGIKKTKGIDMAAVNLATEKATVSYDPKATNLDDIIKSVLDAGYAATVPNEEDSSEEQKEKDKSLKKLKIKTLISALLSAPLVLAMFAGIFKISPLMFLHNPILQLVLATPVQFWIGSRFYKGAWKSIRAGSPGMDVLVVLGTSAAYFFSIFNGFFAETLGVETTGLYFEASAIIITLVLLGKYLESTAKGKTSEAIKKLMGLQPKTARVERDGEVVEVPISDVIPGDLVYIKPGDRIPVDGVIVTGNTAVDESMITGESMPVEKQIGDKLVSGTINSYGAVQFKAEHVGKDSVLSRIISIVEEAQGSKAPIQKLADQVAAVFVPVVLIIAVVTFLIWWLILGSLTSAIVSSVAVLVIACPCALGLATPTAIMVGTGVGAQRGILIKNGEILQSAGKLTTVILDKTGTITMGKPEMQELLPLKENISETDRNDLLSIAASLEDNSEHPLARAVVQAAEGRGLSLSPVENFKAVPGKGITASLNGKSYLIGTEKYLSDNNVPSGSYKDKKAELENQGNTVVVLADGSEALALITIADSIKETSREGVELLKTMGLDVYMITGDNKRTAHAIAAKAGITNVLAEVLPEGKAAEVQKLQHMKKIVAMIGDGVNDAPALAIADTGIAMGQGSDIAMESADITLMRGDLREIAAAIQLSRKTMGKIKQNLFWAFFYNAIGIPFAAMGFLNPIIAGAAMAFSSVSVVSNSLSLKNFKIKKVKLNQVSDSENSNNPKEKNMEVVIKVEGMTCNHCKMAVEKAAGSVDSVNNPEVNLEVKELKFSFSGDEAAIVNSVKSAVKEAGYNPL
ncbi:MAG: heavy metal translocating P-type ATPase [Spirochaetaceae bacterium]|jgi:Cu+-exporting ATPase|nr:heavy metal translocating P-type ATPase [Spirochaetaceae bacterium]